MDHENADLENEIVEAYCRILFSGSAEDVEKLLKYKNYTLAQVFLLLLTTPTYGIMTNLQGLFCGVLQRDILSGMARWKKSTSKHELYALGACCNAHLVAATTGETVTLFEESASLGSYLAMNDLGFLVLDSDPSRAFQLFDVASRQGLIPTATVNLGYCYQEGLGVLKDELQAVELYERSGAVGLNNLATCYELGIGCTIDYERACHYYEMSANLGVADSMFSLSLLLSKGGFGLSIDIDRSMKYLDMAVAHGHVEAKLKFDQIIDDFFCVDGIHMNCSCKTML